MLIQVDSIQSNNSDIVVLFSSDFGCAKANWKGKEPSLNKKYFVEIDIDHIFVWGEDVSLEKDCMPSIHQEYEQISITGYIDSVDEDGYVVLRLGDSILPFLFQGESLKIGTCVRLLTDSLSLYPVDYLQC